MNKTPVLLLLAAISLGCSACGSKKSPTAPGPTSTPVPFYFTSNRVAGEANVFSILPGTASASTVTSYVGGGSPFTIAFAPDYSPTAGKLAMCFFNNSIKSFMGTANADGSNVVTFSGLPTSNLNLDPRWSSDGTKIVFFSTNPSSPVTIYTMSGTGVNLTPILSFSQPSTASFEVGASWSPDGTKIIHAENGRIVVTTTDGSGPATLAADPGASDSCPSFSPDGTQIVFISNRNLSGSPVTQTYSQVFTMSSTGAGLTQVTNDAFNNTEVRWSPDGSKLFYSNLLSVSSDTQLYEINPDGSSEQDLSDGVHEDQIFGTYVIS